jgi:hypothetical protein
MKQKLFFLVLTLLFLSVTSVNAQVRIGGTTDPGDYVVLNLNPDEGEATGGVALPKVHLTDLGSPNPFASFPPQGTLVYNLTDIPGTDITEGVYFTNGNAWFPLLTEGETSSEVTSPIVIIQQPEFIWLGADGSTVSSMGVQIQGATDATTYQWYRREANGSAVELTGQNTLTLTNIQQGNYGIDTEGKVYQYFCVIINGTQYAMSQSGYAVYGIGARLANNGWLRFAPYNLGATAEGKVMSIAQQIAYQPKAANSGAANNAAYDPTVYGDWYQWGRAKDGHQLRTTPAADTYDGLLSSADGLATSFLDPTTGQVTSGDAVGKFIQRNGGTNDWRSYPETDDNSAVAPADAWTWGNPNEVTSNDPCRAELGSTWRVPTVEEWSQIADNNTWVWKIGGTGTGGYEIKTAPGETTSLFLPANGYRHPNDGAFRNLNSQTRYWASSTPGNTSAYNVTGNSSSYNAKQGTVRGYALGVRCVAD